MVTRVTGMTEIVCLSHITLAVTGMTGLSDMTSEENWFKKKESAKKAGVQLYACVLHNCTPFALWNTSSGTDAAPLVAFSLRVACVSHLTSAILRVKSKPLPEHVVHLIRPRDPQLAHGSFPFPLHFTHLHRIYVSLLRVKR